MNKYYIFKSGNWGIKHDNTFLSIFTLYNDNTSKDTVINYYISLLHTPTFLINLINHHKNIAELSSLILAQGEVCIEVNLFDYEIILNYMKQNSFIVKDRSILYRENNSLFYENNQTNKIFKLYDF